MNANPVPNQCIDIIVAQLISEGISHLFATTDSNVFTKLDNSATNFNILTSACPKTITACAMGYSQACLKTSIVFLKDYAQFLEAYPAIYSANLTNIPLIVIYFEDFSQELYHNFNLAKPAKHHIIINNLENLTYSLRNGFFQAGCLPRGPISIRINQQLLNNQVDSYLAYLPPQTNSFNPPDLNFIKKIAQVLFNANSPTIIVGDEINQCGARREVESLAKILAASVYGEAIYTSVNFSTNHEFFLGHLQDDLKYNQAILDKHDVILLIGVKNPQITFIENLQYMQNQKIIIQLNLDFNNIIATIPSYLNLIADIAASCLKIQNEIQALINKNWLDQASARKNNIITQNLTLLKALKANETQSFNALARFLNNLSVIKPAQDPLVACQSLKIHNYSIGFAWTSSSSYYSLNTNGNGLELGQAIGISLACNSSQSVVVLASAKAITQFINPWFLALNHGLNIKFIFLTPKNLKSLDDYFKYLQIESFHLSKDINVNLKKLFDNHERPQAINIVLEK